jgi:hypothetical protein
MNEGSRTKLRGEALRGVDTALAGWPVNWGAAAGAAAVPTKAP